MGDSLIMWGRWLVNNVGFDELRLDAVKHIDPWYIAKFLVETKNGTQPYSIGESFEYNAGALAGYHNAWKRARTVAQNLPKFPCSISRCVARLNPY